MLESKQYSTNTNLHDIASKFEEIDEFAIENIEDSKNLRWCGREWKKGRNEKGSERDERISIKSNIC